MEQLTQRYIKYFYIILIGIIIFQLLDVIVVVLNGGICYETVVLMFLSILNVVLLLNNMRHNLRQRFTECKSTTKVLCFTIALLMIFQSVVYFEESHSWMTFYNCLTTILIIETVLIYRIKSIEYLEKLANRFAKEDMSN